MTVWTPELAVGWYRRLGGWRLVLLCGDCAKRLGYWPGDRLSPHGEGDHDDCDECGRTVE